jgi:type IV secretory pathway VirB2 component (pilin)
MMKRAVNIYGLMAAVIAAAFVLPDIAHAATASGGGGMPYSQGLNTFNKSATGEIAAIICIVCVIGGVAAYMMQSYLEALLQKLTQIIIGVCCVGGVVAFLTAIGVSGAVIP